VVLATLCRLISWLLRNDRDAPTYQKNLWQGNTFRCLPYWNLLRIILYDVLKYCFVNIIYVMHGAFCGAHHLTILVVFAIFTSSFKSLDMKYAHHAMGCCDLSGKPSLSVYCCGLSGGVALIVWFTTIGMCAKNKNICTWREQAIIEWSWRVISGDTNAVNDWT